MKYRLKSRVGVMRPAQAARMPHRATKKTTATMPTHPRMLPLTRDLQRQRDRDRVRCLAEVFSEQ